MFIWVYGDRLYGSEAKAHNGMKEYRRDIERAYGKQDSYKDIYIDTFRTDIPVSEQYKKWKK